MKTLMIQIPNMQSSHCQMRVNKALSAISGATLINTQAGIAHVSLPDQIGFVEVISTIEKAGYYVTDIVANSVHTFPSIDSKMHSSHC
ncbi:MAG: hypothetical protein CMC14_01675 [Flavobacteriaceae bacterium]|jgi:copper chaperone|nr:hypothetical protein [Flavobacteriaceae bacterium]|tara:strand:- start:121749 stop:122012 length:264 start_codon:yes stop_codon:yes gene_type:complete